MEITVLEARERELKSTRNSRRLRQGGRIPGVLYGRQQAVVLLDLDAAALLDFLNGTGRVVALNLGAGDVVNSMLKEVQWDHLGERIYHVDFGRIDLNQAVEVKVEIEVVGLPAIVVSGGGTFVHGQRAVKVRCLPTVIPESIVVAVAQMEIGESLTVANLDLPDGVELASDVSADSLVVAVVSKTAVEDDAEMVAADEVAVIGEPVEAAEGAAE
jgi:large subunit ribosomal protein L25